MVAFLCMISGICMVTMETFVRACQLLVVFSYILVPYLGWQQPSLALCIGVVLVPIALGFVTPKFTLDKEHPIRSAIVELFVQLLNFLQFYLIVLFIWRILGGA